MDANGDAQSALQEEHRPSGIAVEVGAPDGPEEPQRRNSIASNASRLSVATSAAAAVINARGSERSSATRRSSGDGSSWFVVRRNLEGLTQGERMRLALRDFVDGARVQSVIGVLILFNFVIICLDANVRAVGDATPPWMVFSSMLCLTVFTLEFVARCFIDGYKVFNDAWNVLDFLIISLAVIEELLSTSNLGFLRVTRMFRMLRMFKLVRILRAFKSLRELKKLANMMESCCRTLVWALIVSFFMMTVFAIFAVELVHPVMAEIQASGIWEGCERCPRSFSSVMAANITFFQTIVAGDSWGLVAIPVMEAYPATSILFVGALFTLVYGLLQLIVCVVVDSFAEIRERDTSQRAQEKQDYEIFEKRDLAKLFRQIDKDDSGLVTLDELEAAAESVEAFAERLTCLDISKTDLGFLFQLLDSDNSGCVDCDEFIEVLYRMTNTESKSALQFVKQMVSDVKRKQEEMVLSLEEKVKAVEDKVSKSNERKRTMKLQTMKLNIKVASPTAAEGEKGSFGGAAPTAPQSEAPQSEACAPSLPQSEAPNHPQAGLSLPFLGKTPSARSGKAEPSTPRKQDRLGLALESALGGAITEAIQLCLEDQLQSAVTSLSNSLDDAVSRSVDEMKQAFAAAEVRRSQRSPTHLELSVDAGSESGKEAAMSRQLSSAAAMPRQLSSASAKMLRQLSTASAVTLGPKCDPSQRIPEFCSEEAPKGAAPPQPEGASESGASEKGGDCDSYSAMSRQRSSGLFASGAWSRQSSKAPASAAASRSNGAIAGADGPSRELTDL